LLDQQQEWDWTPQTLHPNWCSLPGGSIRPYAWTALGRLQRRNCKHASSAAPDSDEHVQNSKGRD
jgi:hypothetical protein